MLYKAAIVLLVSLGLLFACTGAEARSLRSRSDFFKPEENFTVDSQELEEVVSELEEIEDDNNIAKRLLKWLEKYEDEDDQTMDDDDEETTGDDSDDEETGDDEMDNETATETDGDEGTTYDDMDENETSTEEDSGMDGDNYTDTMDSESRRLRKRKGSIDEYIEDWQAVVAALSELEENSLADTIVEYGNEMLESLMNARREYMMEKRAKMYNNTDWEEVITDLQNVTVKEDKAAKYLEKIEKYYYKYVEVNETAGNETDWDKIIMALTDLEDPKGKLVRVQVKAKKFLLKVDKYEPKDKKPKDKKPKDDSFMYNSTNWEGIVNELLSDTNSTKAEKALYSIAKYYETEILDNTIDDDSNLLEGANWEDIIIALTNATESKELKKLQYSAYRAAHKME